MYKALFLLAFHGFLRISNLLPTSQTSNQTHRHLTRGDVSITHPGVKVFIKWSKTLQANRDTRILPLASIPGSPLCPMQAAGIGANIGILGAGRGEVRTSYLQKERCFPGVQPGHPGRVYQGPWHMEVGCHVDLPWPKSIPPGSDLYNFKTLVYPLLLSLGFYN